MNRPYLQEGQLFFPGGIIDLDDADWDELSRLVGWSDEVFGQEEGSFSLQVRCEAGVFLLYFDEDWDFLQLGLELFEPVDLVRFLEEEKAHGHLRHTFFDYEGFTFCLFNKNFLVRLDDAREKVVGLVFQASLFVDNLETDLGQTMRKLAQQQAPRMH